MIGTVLIQEYINGKYKVKGNSNFVIYFGQYFSIKFWALLYPILNILSNEEKIVELNVENQLVMEKQRFCFALIVVRFFE